MTDKGKFQFLVERFKKLDATSNPTYKFMVTALFDDPSQPPFACTGKERGAAKLEEAVTAAIKGLKPDAVKVDKYANSTAETSDESNVFRVTSGDKTTEKPLKQKTQRVQKENDRSIEDKFEQYMAKIDAANSERHVQSKEREALYTEKLNLLGSVNENNLDKIRHEHQIAMLTFQHELEKKELERTIKEREEENADVASQLQEALGMLDTHNKRFEREGKWENSARDITALAKGAFSVAPGLMKIANQYGLGGLAAALTDDSHSVEGMLPSPDGSSIEGTEDQTQGEKFAKIQSVINFCNELNETDLSGFLVIVREFEKNPSSMKDIFELLQA